MDEDDAQQSVRHGPTGRVGGAVGGSGGGGVGTPGLSRVGLTVGGSGGGGVETPGLGRVGGAAGGSGGGGVGSPGLGRVGGAVGGSGGGGVGTPGLGREPGAVKRSWASVLGGGLPTRDSKNVLEVILEKDTRGAFIVTETECANMMIKLGLDPRPGVHVEMVQICPQGTGGGSSSLPRNQMWR